MPPKRVAFVTGNKGKLEEVRHTLSAVGVDVAQADVDPVEVQADTLEEVARGKAEDAARKVDGPVLVDDAGLFVDALNGFPGVYSAFVLKTIGLDGLLRLMEGRSDRGARFEAVLAYRDDAGEVRCFKGVCEGRLADAPRSGGHGFGYDPVFVPEGHDRTFAELPLEEKNRLSHRGRALDQLVQHFRGA